MQNIDFYSGRKQKINIPQQQYMDHSDPEFYSRVATPIQHHPVSSGNSKQKATRVLFFIAALTIISFTTGLALGIKFAGKKDIVDKDTYKAMSSIGTKVSDIIAKDKKTGSAITKNSFPKSVYPYVIKVSSAKKFTEAKEIANFLSKRGHRVIISKSTKGYKLYAGPYKNKKNALVSANIISKYRNFPLGASIKVIHRI